MSKYTTELRYICENASGLSDSEGYDKIPEIIERSREKIFDFDYPIYDESYRSVLETKIIKHFYTREISAETVGLWKHWLDTKMNEIMPFYNQKYKTTLLEFNPLYDVDLHTEADRDKDGDKTDYNVGNESNNNTRDLTHTDDISSSNTQTTSASGTADNTTEGTTRTEANENDTKWKYYSDTPQGYIGGVEDRTYLTNLTKDTDKRQGIDESKSNSKGNNSYADQGEKRDSLSSEKLLTEHETDNRTKNRTNTLTSNFKNTEQYIQHVYGKRGTTSYSKLLEEFRKTILNIDMEIINELNELFIQLW